MQLLAAAAADEAEQREPSSTKSEPVNSPNERKTTRKARKFLVRRARKRQARRLPKTPRMEKKESVGRKRKGEEAERRAKEERQKKRAAKIAIQDRLAAEERERRKKRDKDRAEWKKKEAEIIAEVKRAEKQAREENTQEWAAARTAALKEPVDAVALKKPAKSPAEAAEVEAAGEEISEKDDGKLRPTDNDVLLGRGGATNAHEGNKRFRQYVLKIQPTYIAMQSRAKKSLISQSIVDQVKSAGGRFLKQADGEWVVVSDFVAAKKASQALRENAKQLKQLCHAADDVVDEDGGKAMGISETEVKACRDMAGNVE